MTSAAFSLRRLASIVAILVAALAATIAGPAGAAVKAKPRPLGELPAVRVFIAQMQATHDFDPVELRRQFAAVHANTAVLKAIRPAAVPELQRSWERYRTRFLNDRRINAGLRFWQEHRGDLERAEAEFGVPPEIVVAIIGVETEYGRNMGKFGVFEALATLAFEYPPRADFFRGELEQFLLLARENRIDPLSVRGSYAGAIGIGQFMPGSLRRFAVDFDGDQRIDLRQSAADAIGSVASYLGRHGWQVSAPIAVPARLAPDPGEPLAAGIKPERPLGDYRARGVSCAAELPDDRPAVLVDLVSPGQPTEWWIGFDNFYVITRYNRSSFYAMAVFQLAEALRTGMPVAAAGSPTP